MASDGSRLLELIAKYTDDKTVEVVLASYGGSRVVVGGKMGPGNWLTDIVGQEIALKIVDELDMSSSEHVVLPIAERSRLQKLRREIAHCLKLGQSTDRIARELGVSRRTVSRHRLRLKTQERKNSSIH